MYNGWQDRDLLVQKEKRDNKVYRYRHHLVNTMILITPLTTDVYLLAGDTTVNGRYKQANSFCGEFLLTVKCIN